MWSFLLALINPLANIASEIAKYKISAVNAVTDQERIAAQERVASLEAQRDVLLKGSRLDTFVRTLIAIGPAAFLTKIFLWDKVLGNITQGRTDELTDHLWYIVMVVVGFYFIHSTVAMWKRS